MVANGFAYGFSLTYTSVIQRLRDYSYITLMLVSEKPQTLYLQNVGVSCWALTCWLSALPLSNYQPSDSH